MFSQEFEEELDFLLSCEVERRVCGVISDELAGFTFDGTDNADFEGDTKHMLNAFTSKLHPRHIASLSLMLVRHCLNNGTVVYDNYENELNDNGWSRSIVKLGPHWTDDRDKKKAND